MYITYIRILFIKKYFLLNSCDDLEDKKILYFNTLPFSEETAIFPGFIYEFFPPSRMKPHAKID